MFTGSVSLSFATFVPDVDEIDYLPVSIFTAHLLIHFTYSYLHDKQACSFATIFHYPPGKPFSYFRGLRPNQCNPNQVPVANRIIANIRFRW